MSGFDGTVIIVADGGCENNGAPNATAYGSYVLVAMRDGMILKQKESGRLNYPEHHTNNQAEFQVLIDALSVLVTPVSESAGHDYPIIYKTDSQLVVNTFNGTWKCRDGALAALLQSARSIATKFPQLSVVWVPREEVARVLGH